MRSATILPGGVHIGLSRYEIEWETLAPHPTVMAETTHSHRIIAALGVSDGTLLVGYGDWTANLGPVDVIGYDLETLEPVTLWADLPPALASEAWGNIRIFDGKAYLSHTDPTLNNQGAYTTNERGVWETVKVGENPSMIHSFDLAIFKGRKMVCGSMSAAGGAGCVYTETAQGSRIFTRTLLGNGRADFARFYKFFVSDDGNEIRVQNVTPGVETFSTVNGTDWIELPGEPRYKGSGASNWFIEAVTDIPAGYAEAAGLGSIYSAYQHDGWLYVGGGSGIVKRTRLPKSFTSI